MPSFALLSETKIDALAEYVKYLSIRGETELLLMKAFDGLDADAKEILPETREFLIGEMLLPASEKWLAAKESQIPVPLISEGVDLVESIAKGRALFYGDKANCVKCHGVTGLGDGQANDYDDWNKPIVEIKSGLDKRFDDNVKKKYETFFGKNSYKSSTWSEWSIGNRVAIAMAKASISPEDSKLSQVLDGDSLKPRTIVPRNLRHGVYRGGRRPLDLYYRIYAGINGAPMPAAKGAVSPEDIWHIVNYVRSLPYEFDGELGADRPLIARERF